MEITIIKVFNTVFPIVFYQNSVGDSKPNNQIFSVCIATFKRVKDLENY